MPKRDPFADKRRTLKGVKPKQAAIQINRKKSRDQKRLPKASRELAELKKEQSQVERDIEKKKEIQEYMSDLMASAPTPADQRKLILGMFHENGFNPIQVMMNSLPRDENGQPYAETKEDRAMLKDLAGYFASKPKSIDLQATGGSSLSIQVTNFEHTTQKDVIDAAAAAKSADPIYDVSEETTHDYSEFEAPEASIEVTKNESDDGLL